MAENAMEDAKLHPLVIFYDSEAAYGNVYRGDIIEIAAKCHPDVVKGSFQSLINTKQPLCAFATRECAISEEHLKNKPPFKEVLKRFLAWIDNMVKAAKRRHEKPFFPVLCAHHGYQFDFLILLSNMERSGLHHTLLSQHNIHFADSLLFCSELKDKGEKLLVNTKLSLDGLFKKFFPRRIIKDRHRAMGDVEAMVSIFCHTPLRKQLQHMKYSSTKERLDYYISQTGMKQQQAILEENLCKLDACSKNMTVKKLLKEGVTYNSLITIFEECCSFLDFYEAMKSYGVERKVAKVIALHFSGKGLENQGARAYARFHEEKLATPNSAQETSEDPASGNRFLDCDNSEGKQESQVSVDTKQPEAKLVQEEGGENWESEVQNGVPRESFTLKCTTATPLSLNVDDFSSSVSRRNKGKESPRDAGVSNVSKTGHAHSETSESRKVEVNSKKPRGKASSAEVSGRKFQSSFGTESRGKRAGSKNKAVNEGMLEGRVKKERVISSRKENKEEALKSTDVPEESGKENEPSVNDQESLGKMDVKSLDSGIEQCVSSGGDSARKNQKQSQSTVIPSLKRDSSTTEVAEKFASILIGDIAILVPVDNGGQVCDSGESALGEPRSGVQDQAGNSIADERSRDKNTLPTSRESSPDAMQPDLMESSPRCAYAENYPQSDYQSQPQDQTEKDVTKYDIVADSEDADTSVCDHGLDNLELSAGIAKIVNQVESSLQAVTASGDSSATDANETVISGDISRGNNVHRDNFSSLSDARNANEDVNHGEVTVPGTSTSDTVEESIVPVENESSPSEAFLGRSDITGIPWEKLQQLPHAALPEEGVVPERFVMSEGLACHVMSTSDMDHTRHDLQAELSSESSSTSGDSMDAFSRQPPLGAERGFTPDSVQQQPDQLAWEGSVNDGVYSMPPGPVGMYPQGALPPYSNPYGSFHQAQQALRLIKPYYSSFGYPSQIRHAIPPHMIQPHHQVFVTPYLQYRNQMMFSNAMPPASGFPSPAVPSPQLRPQMYQVWQGPTSFSYPPAPFNGNPYYHTQEATGGMLDVRGALLSNALPQISFSAEYQNPIMGSSDSAVSVVRDESGTESPSTASSDSPFELMNVSTNRSSFQPVRELSIVSKKSFSVQTESDPGHSTLQENQDGTEQELEEQEIPEGDDIITVSSLAQLCYKEVSGNGRVHLNQLTDHSHLNDSKEFSRSTISLDQGDLVHKQITILSREENAVAMGRRLSPDGSSVDAVCYDTSSPMNNKRTLKENSAPASTCKDSSQGNVESKASDGSIKDRRPSPKPQRIKGSRGRKTKHSQDRRPANGELRSDAIPGVNPVDSPVPTSSKNVGADSSEQCGERPTLTGNKMKTDSIPRTVRFSKENAVCENVASTENVKNVEASQSCSYFGSFSTPRTVDEGHEGNSQRHAEKGGNVMLSRPPKVERNSRKRAFNNRTRRSHTVKQPLKHPSKGKGQETDKRTDTNNNSN